MKIFTINEVERFTEIKAHTLRVWESRYSFLHPKRTPGNTRAYDLSDVEHLLNIVLLKKNGLRVSELSRYSKLEVKEKAARLANDESKWEAGVNNLFIYMYSAGNPLFEEVLDELLSAWPIHVVVQKILLPFLYKTKLLWVGHKFSEEHLVVTAIRKKIIFGIESISTKPVSKGAALLFLPDSRQLDLALLYANYILKQKGIRLIYLGNDVTINNLKNIIPAYPLSHIFTYLPDHNNFNCNLLINYMQTCIPKAKLVVGKYTDKLPLYEDFENVVQLEFSMALNYLCNDLSE